MRTDAATRELHQPLDDEESEPGALIGATARIDARALPEQQLTVGHLEADAAVTHRKLHFVIRAARIDRDGSAALRGHRRQRIFQQVAHHDIQRERVRQYPGSPGNPDLDLYAIVTSAV